MLGTVTVSTEKYKLIRHANHNDFKRSYKIIYASLLYFLETGNLLILFITEKAVTFSRGLES